MGRGIREAHVNSELIRVYDGDILVGFVRKGMDNNWYPELPPSRQRADAVRDLLRAFDALRRIPVS